MGNKHGFSEHRRATFHLHRMLIDAPVVSEIVCDHHQHRKHFLRLTLHAGVARVFIGLLRRLIAAIARGS
ncbi:MAG: hypothetical protein EBS75_05490 [Betaproteobacteria bacterium]|nr:hypothetical protein [Betaproteobacteria bacterium]